MWEEDESYTGDEHEEDIYAKEEAEELLEDDELVTREEAFMRGYDEVLEKGESGEKRCRVCGYEVDLDDKVCPVCGATLRAASEEA